MIEKKSQSPLTTLAGAGSSGGLNGLKPLPPQYAIKQITLDYILYLFQFPLNIIKRTSQFEPPTGPRPALLPPPRFDAILRPKSNQVPANVIPKKAKLDEAMRHKTT